MMTGATDRSLDGLGISAVSARIGQPAPLASADPALDADGLPRIEKWPGWLQALNLIGCVLGAWIMAMGLVALVAKGVDALV
jgi:hypothetical protein